MTNVSALNGWWLHNKKANEATGDIEAILMYKNTPVCSYKRMRDPKEGVKYAVDNVVYLPEMRKQVSYFAKEVISILGKNFKEGTILHKLRSEGYYGSLAFIIEVLLMYTLATERITKAFNETKEDIVVVYVLTEKNVIDSNETNDDKFYLFKRQEKDLRKLMAAIDDEAKRNNINMKLVIPCSAVMPWQITLQQYFGLYRFK